MLIKIGSRKSDLARIQAYTVAERLKSLDPNIQIEFLFKSSFGDNNLDVELTQFGSRGVFTQDLHEDLVSGRCDLVVHSWKDLPVESNDITDIVGTLERADSRELLLVKAERLQLIKDSKKIKILTSSPRREYLMPGFLKKCFPTPLNDISFKSIRGNIPTRFEKWLQDEAADAFVVAKAAVDRLLSLDMEEFTGIQKTLRSILKEQLWMVVPESMVPAAPAQGALAIEVKRSNSKVIDLIKRLNHQTTFECVTHERLLLKQYGGGCHQKFGIQTKQTQLGQWTIKKGLLDSGEVIDSIQVDKYHYDVPRTDASKVWPAQMKDVSPVVQRTSAQDFEIAQDLVFVTKHEALGQSTSLENKIVWTPGVETWAKLAGQGIWVNGCQDRLGEDVGFGLSQMFPQVSKVKLTHSQKHKSSMDAIGTYDIKYDWSQVNLKDYSHFYWPSYNMFLSALNECSTISQGVHFCGQGNTYELIKDNHSNIKIYPVLKYEMFKKIAIKDS